MYKSDYEDLAELPPLITVNEAAGIARVCPKFMRDLLRDGKIKGTKMGTVWRVNTASLLAYCGLREEVVA